MNMAVSHYVDFQRFFQTRQNLDLVAAEHWRHAAEIAAQASRSIPRPARRPRKTRKTS
jgi:hypothetical protein